MSAIDSPVAAPAPDAPKRSKRLLLVVVAAVVAAAAAGYVVSSRGAGAPAEEAPAEAAVAEGEVLEVGTVTTNLAGSPGRYARVGVALVLAADADPVAVQGRIALVKDAALRVIGRQEAAALQTPEGSTALRAQLTEEITAVYPEGTVLRVVLTELLVQ